MDSLPDPVTCTQNPKRVYLCPYINRSNGARCPTSSQRKWNVQRHIKDKHTGPNNTRRFCLLQDSRNESLVDVEIDNHNRSPPETPLIERAQSTSIVPRKRRSTETQEESNDNSSADPTASAWLGTSFHKSPLPTYDVKRSKKTPGQQRGILWLTAEARETFQERYATVLAQWGLRSSHQGTCVLIPAQWEALNPLTLCQLFTAETCPPHASDRIRYEYADHSTTFARALAWFSHHRWRDSGPRGVDLDNFLDGGAWKSSHGSHLCHHDNCVIHVVYEHADINFSRKDCHAKARFLRGERLEVPPRCDQHDPPCLLQHAALTTYEVYLIQFSILYMAHGLDPIIAPPKPRRHTYETFETQLPIQAWKDSPYHLDPADFKYILPASKTTPELICRFCQQVRSFKSVTGLWSHIIHKHSEVDNQERLLSVREIAEVWETHWLPTTRAGKSDPLRLRLRQLARKEVTWEDVLAWNLK